MITFNNVVKNFNGVDVLKEINGEFQPGKINMIIGTSGAGKSVFLKCLIGIFGVNEGSIKYDDVLMTDDLYEPKVREIKKSIGVLFQNGALFSSKTIEENVRFPLDLLTNMSTREKNDRVHECLSQVNLHNVGKKYPNEISGGMQKRVALARAIVNIPKYLFCDEPNSGLDPKISLMIDELLQTITTQYGITTIVISHNIDSIMKIGDNIMYLSNGKKEWEGSNNDILNTTNKNLLSFLKSSKTFKSLYETVHHIV